MATSNAVRGAGLLTNFWKAVEEEIRAIGGTDEHLATLDTKKARPAIRELAKLVVNGVIASVASFQEQIRAGRYDYLWGFADGTVDKIEGQTFHLPTGEVELDHPGRALTTQEVWERYGDGDLSELLDYGIKNPDVQLQYTIGIVWKVGNQFWYAILSSDGSDRGLGVNRDHPDLQWDGDSRFLRRK